MAGECMLMVMKSRNVCWVLTRCHRGSPKILEGVAYPFSRGSSRPRNQTGVSCIAGRFFTNWAIREAHWVPLNNLIGMCMLSCFIHVWLFVTLWTVTHQTPLSMGFSRQECWSGLPCPLLGDLPHPGIKPGSLITLLNWQASSLPLAPPGEPLTTTS